MTQNATQKKKAMLHALEQTLGVVTPAAKMVDIARKTHYRWMENDPKYKAAVEDMDNIALDFSESKLHKNIADGKEASIIFHLKTRGKSRGYIEKSEVDHTTGGDKLPAVNITVAPVSEKERLASDESQIDFTRG